MSGKLKMIFNLNFKKSFQGVSTCLLMGFCQFDSVLNRTVLK